jgi:hypothetical protein
MAAMKRILPVLALSALLLSACGTAPVATATAAPTPVPPTATPLPDTPVPATQIVSWIAYNDPAYGHSFEYPGSYQVTVVGDTYLEIGDKIVVEVWDMDPTAPLGDGPAVESSTDIQVSGYPARLLTGYIGSIGGYVPQQFRRIVVERNGIYFMVTLYALGLHASGGDVSQIVPLDPEDVPVFDGIVASMNIP